MTRKSGPSPIQIWISWVSPLTVQSAPFFNFNYCLPRVWKCHVTFVCFVYFWSKIRSSYWFKIDVYWLQIPLQTCNKYLRVWLSQTWELLILTYPIWISLTTSLNPAWSKSLITLCKINHYSSVLSYFPQASTTIDQFLSSSWQPGGTEHCICI